MGDRGWENQIGLGWGSGRRGWVGHGVVGQAGGRGRGRWERQGTGYWVGERGGAGRGGDTACGWGWGRCERQARVGDEGVGEGRVMGAVGEAVGEAGGWGTGR